MSAPADKKAVERLEEAARKNEEAGDWVYSTLPFSNTPVRIDEITPEDVLKLIGDQSIPKPKKEG